MLGNMIKAVFGSKNERELKRLEPVVAQINELEPDFQKLPNEQFPAKTGSWG